MIDLRLDWREVLWWMQGGMAGSHLRWSVYEDMVDKVWPQCTEEERRNIFLIMRRDLGTYWRPDGWRSVETEGFGEGEWKDESEIFDKTPWMYFRQVLARFNPDNQFAVTMGNFDRPDFDYIVNSVPSATIIKLTAPPRRTVTVRTYLWDDAYMIDWSRRCADKSVREVRRMDLA